MGGGEPRTAELFPGESAQAGSLFYALAEVSLARAEYADLSVHVLKIFARNALISIQTVHSLIERRVSPCI